MKKTLPIIGIMSLIMVLFSFKMIDGPKKAAAGTYQFVIKDTKKEFVYTDEVLIMIEEKRKDLEEITLALNGKVEVIIPSKDAIHSPSFKPLAEFFYIN